MNTADLLNDPAAVLAFAMQICPSMNGASSHRLAWSLEVIAAGADYDIDDSVRGTIENLRPAAVEQARAILSGLDGVHMVTVLDDEYPANLRMIQDHPPLLFVRGSITEADTRAIAVVGTRNPSDSGVTAARALGKALAQRSVTAVSGMATGIDTAAHVGALNVGGRTIAVFGTGISRVYPRSNQALARGIPSSGAVVSQFMPDQTGTRWSFPVRNIVTSGLALATVVVEAGPTSGAKLQAHDALRHGKRVFLLRDLVESQPWAAELIGTPGVTAIDDPHDVDGIVTMIELELDVEAALVV